MGNLISTASLDEQLRRFLQRDYRADGKRLNSSISKSDHGAGLIPSMPPIPYTGDPFKLLSCPNTCFAFIGLNPKWREKDNDRKTGEYDPFKQCVDRLRNGDVSGLVEIKRLRGEYFRADNSIYYGTYFTKIGRYVGEELCGQNCNEEPNQFARRIFRTRVFKTDFVPWFSQKAHGIDWKKVATSADEAIGQYHQLLISFLTALQPRWIQCNGLASCPLVESLFDAKLKEESVTVREKRYRFYVGDWRSSSRTVPILVHGFIGRWQNRDSFHAICEKFKSLTSTSVFRSR